MSVAPESVTTPEPTPEPTPKPTPEPGPTPDDQYVLEEPKTDSVPSQGETTGGQTTKP